MLARHHQRRSHPLSVHPHVAVLLLLAAWFIIAQAAEAASVFKSTDGGRSWSRSDRGLPGEARLNAFGSVGASFLAGTDVGIFMSRDQGQAWQASTGVARSSGRVVAFATLGGKIYAGTDRSGILESFDEGLTWAVNRSFASENVRSILGHQGKLYVGKDADGVLRSSDHGRSWDRLDHGFPQNAQVFALAALQETLFAGLYSKGLYRWDEPGRRWRKVEPVSPLALATIGDTLVVGHNPGGICVSDDLGASWAKATPTALGDLALPVPGQSGGLASDAPVWELASNAELVFAGAGPGIFYSEDKGRTWTRARHGLPEESPGVAFLLKGGLILAATPGRMKDQ